MKKGFLITGRMKSTRLKKKLTLELLDREVITQMIDRAKLVFENDEIVIATSTNPQDDALAEIAQREGVQCYRGHEDDVVLRLYTAAKENDFDYFINITADCPLFGFDYVDKTFDTMENQDADLVTSLDLPHGIFIYGIRTSALGKVIEIKHSSDTEVWGDYFYKNEDIFNVQKLNISERLIRPDFRLTLDYPEDFKFFQALYDHFGRDTYKLTTDEIVDYLDHHPEVVNINKECKKMYTERWESQRPTDSTKLDN